MTTTVPQKLFTPLKLGAIALKHRVIMAPLTRTRSPGGIPNENVVKYYGQRASDGGLLISEATHISLMGGNYYHVPGIYTPEQIRAWKKVTDAVHKKGGYIFCQLWHVGRTAHPSNLQGLRPVAPSDVKFTGKIYFTPEGPLDSVNPRPMTIEEIKNTIDDYVHAAKSAIAAGFDGVEIHGANGYLIDQFISSNINTRIDEYGGSVEKRARFALDVVDAVIKAVGVERTGIRLSPFGFFQDTFTEDPVRDYGYVIEQLEKRRLAYVHLIEIRLDLEKSSPKKFATLIERAKARGVQNLEDELGIRPFRKLLANTPIIGNGTYLATPSEPKALDVEQRIGSGEINAAAFGRYFISNPDLSERLKHKKELNMYDRETFYTQGSKGYTDYPTWDENVQGTTKADEQPTQLYQITYF
ncbi:FMN-linked oxidoreductase [Terfezia boudieri ATCC MYA-4762]|uniref:FMN-linked oxidoreductase n=1 Tax=Terfezia boudieri ATCC MYA-4762 TaxID=1051890 RepID=A0A3N4MCA0_9PEZI|nr:FMN-linked oxidoreductase [Terfezia boudieri ATCC MYA-4762]